MSLPDFMCIGAMRSGTTWLDKVLRSHPNIYLPEKRKEIHFFDQYYDRGIEWYEDFFPNVDNLDKDIKLGEITPAYLYFKGSPQRIFKSVPNCRFIVIFRNPAERAYSHYGFLVKNYNERRAFEKIFAEEQELFLKGLYGAQMERYLQYFPIEKFLFLFYEEIAENPMGILGKIGDFLEVPVDGFDINHLREKRNTSGYPRFPKARALACTFRDNVRKYGKYDLDWFWNLAKKSGLEQIFESQKNKLEPLNQETRTKLISKYEPDITKLEQLINVDLSSWKNVSLCS